MAIERLDNIFRILYVCSIDKMTGSIALVNTAHSSANPAGQQPGHELPGCLES
jgi:hypothetical protein